MAGSERVMVFGAGGFLGSAIRRLLVDRGIEHCGMTSRPIRLSCRKQLGWSARIPLEQSLLDSWTACPSS